MYKAKIAIGGYKVGDEVPADKAKLWAEMYKESPVEKIGEESTEGDSGNDDDGAEAPEKSDAMHDDYLNRKGDVVLKAIKDDELDDKVLKSLLKIESKNKKRKPVLNAIENKLKNS